MANHLRHLREARAVSLLSDFDRVHLGCVIVYNGRTIAAGCNNRKSSPMQAKYNQHRTLWGSSISHLLHAETAAVITVRHRDIDWRKCIVYTYREGKNGKPMLSRPCPACMAMLQELGVRKIVYSNDVESGWCEERIA